MPIVRYKIRFILMVAILQLWSATTSAVGISSTVSSTPSLCFDNGSLTITSAGGTGPYTLTLISGPSGPNINYPLSLAPGVTFFGGLPQGTYAIESTDALGDTSTFSATVGGNYIFPTLTYNTTSLPNTIIALESDGRAPFAYAISSTGSDTGFSAYQASDTFSHLCPGNYWIRVIDTCGNIYTDEVTFSYTLSNNINCINFSKGTLDVTASGGTPPYTYTIDSMTNSTGDFTGLPAYFSSTLTITDACGVTYRENLAPLNAVFTERCPSDSIIYLSSLAYPITPDTFTFICTNCIPAQSVTVPYTTPIALQALFRDQPQGTNYHIVVLSSACGGDTLPSTPPTIQRDIQISTTFISCRSFQATVTNAGAPAGVDSFVLSYVPYGPSIQTNATGIFDQLPDSAYTVTAYITAMCGDTPMAHVVIPHFIAGCFTLMRDSSCNNVWEYSTSSIAPELYSLIWSPGDTIAGSVSQSFNANFYGLASDTTYTLISDSGCAEVIHTPPATVPAISVVAYLPCVGQPIVKFTATNNSYCNGSSTPSTSQVRIRLSFMDSVIFDQYESTVAPYIVNVSQSGWYHYSIFAANSGDTSYALRYDTICPIDTGSVFMDNTQIPYLYSTVALVCDSIHTGDTVYYQVYGGSAPYTVEVPGYDTTILQTNTGIFPTRRAGTYTMIVYDNCGISRSVTFDIIDTCSGCPYAAIYLPDTFSCAGDTVKLTSVSIHGKTYQWYVNGTLYSTAKDTILVSAAGGSNIMLRVVSSTGCADTAYIHTLDTCRGCPYPAIALSDTQYCVGNIVQLINASISGVSYQWQINGQPYSTAADTTYTITAVGTDTITLSVTSATGCTEPATAYIYVISPYRFDLGPDTIYCADFSRLLSTGIDSTSWSTGQTGPQITVNQAGTYTASAGNRCGYSAASIKLSQNPVPTVNLGDDTTLCAGAKLILDAGNPGDTYVWQEGSINETLTVDAGGTYSVSVSSEGCTGSAEIKVTYISPPAAFSLGSDTTICSIDPLRLDGSQLNAYYSWNTGSTEPSITVDQSGLYVLTDSNACGTATDSINVMVEKCSCRVIIPTAFTPNNDGKNDTYGAIAPCIPSDFSLEIFDRWGQKMFYTDNIDGRWDGKYEGHPQPLAVYAYYMKYTDPYTNITYKQSGNVTLVR